MTLDSIIEAFQLPDDCRIRQRVPKKTLIEQGGFPSTDKRRITDGIEELWWIAALKPGSIGIKEFIDDQRQYTEIAVLIVNFRPKAKVQRLIELIHRAIPYPVVLVSQQDATFSLTLAHKRQSQAESGKVVLDGKPLIVDLYGDELATAFISSLSIQSVPSQNLFDLYQGWIERLQALIAAKITGNFRLTDSPAERRTALEEYDRLQKELAKLRAQAKREKQINRRVELNLSIRDREDQLQQLKSRLA